MADQDPRLAEALEENTQGKPEGDPAAAAMAIVRGSQELKKPLQWQDFQARCVVLFQDELGDPHCKEYGRLGQDQGGIDLLGRRGAQYVAIQCRLIKTPLKKETIQHDAQAALKLPYKFAEIIFATTAPDSTKATDAAHEVEEELRADGHEVRIEVYGWGALQQLIARHPRASAYFSPATTGVIQDQSVLLGINRIESSVLKLQDMVAAQSKRIIEPLQENNDIEGEDPALHARIDAFRDLMKDGEPQLALNKLTDLLSSIDSTKSPYAFYRVKANLASAHHDMGKIKEATDLWIEAHELRSEDARAIANLGLAKLLLGQFQEAMDLAEAALRKSSTCKEATSVFLQAAARSNWKGDADAWIPKELKGTTQADAGLLEYKRITGNQSWITDAKRLAATHDDPYFKHMAALAVLDGIISAGEFFPGNISKLSPGELTEATNHLKALFENKVKHSSDEAELAAMANNAALALRISARFEEAEAILKTAINRIEAAPAFLTRLLGVVQTLNGNVTEGMATLSTISDDGEAQLARAEMLAEQDRAGALELAKSISTAGLSPNNKRSKAMLVCELGISLRDETTFQAALEELKQFVSDHDTALVRLFELDGAVRFGTNTTEDAKAELTTIAGSLPVDTAVITRIAIAQQLLTWDEGEAASRLLEGHVDLATPSQATKMYLQALASARRDRAFDEALRKASDLTNSDPDVLWMAAAHAWNTGDLSKAEAFATKLVTLEPSDLRYVLLKIDILNRQDKQIEIKEILDAPIELSQRASTSDRFRLARLLQHFNFVERASNLAYRLYLENRDQSRAWMTIVGVVLSRGNAVEGKSAFEMNAAGPNAAVDFKSASGATHFVVIEPDATLRALDSDAIEPTHAQAIALDGHRVGEKLEMPDGTTVEITQIRHKIIARFHDITARYEKRFPAKSDFRSLSVNTDSENGLDELREAVKQRYDFAIEEARNYATTALPLEILARRVGVDVIDAAAGIADAGFYFKVANGTVSERTAATRSIRENSRRGCVIDPYSYWICFALGILDLVANMVGKVHLSHRTLDVLRSRRARLSESAGGHKSMSYRDGHIALVETTGEAVEAAITKIDEAIAWAETNATILPITASDKIPEELRRFLQQGQINMLDEAVLAMDNDLLLVCDDLPARQIGMRFGVQRATWTQAILLRAVDIGLISQGVYAEKLGELVSARHDHVGVSVNVLLAAIEMDVDAGLDRPGKLFKTLSSALGGKNADPGSHVSVAFGAIVQLWRADKARKLREAATGIILESVIRERADYLEFLGTMLAQSAGRLRQYILAWLKGHFIGDFFARKRR